LKINYKELKFIFKVHISNQEEEYIYSAKKKINFQSYNSKEKLDKINTKNFSATLFSEANSKRYINNLSPAKNTKELKIIPITFPKYLENFIKKENEMEIIRLNMAVCNDIILSELFFLFDFTQQNQISKKNFQDTLNKFQVYPTNEEIDLIFKSYDLDGNGVLE
jgi:hypothetical protein